MAKIVCKYCGGKLSESLIFCDQCGRDQDDKDDFDNKEYGRDNIASKVAEELSHEMSATIDYQIGMAIKPKPRFIPTFIWNFLIKKLLNVEIIQGAVKVK